jgi:hypothetical protein
MNFQVWGCNGLFLASLEFSASQFVPNPSYALGLIRAGDLELKKLLDKPKARA